MVDSPRPRPTDARRRRRVRVIDEATEASGDSGTGTGASAQTTPVHDELPAWPVSDADATAIERGLRGIVGGGSSQVSPGAALRARDAARPRQSDLERSESELTVIRRYWTPRD